MESGIFWLGKPSKSRSVMPPAFHYSVRLPPRGAKDGSTTQAVTRCAVMLRRYVSFAWFILEGCNAMVFCIDIRGGTKKVF